MMAIQTLFQSIPGPMIPRATAVNEENAPAYARTPEQALAQYAATGCFGNTFYATAEEQLTRVLDLCESLDPAFVAQVAVYSRTQAFLKDMPALLCAWLSKRDARLHEAVFARVIDSTRMLRTYVQILRSGTTGRKSLGSAPKRLVREWLAARSEEQLFRSSAGQSPSLDDMIKMVHPVPDTPAREAFYGYMLDRGHDPQALPELVQQFERLKAGQTAQVPDLPFMLLSALPLSKEQWTEIAGNASWQTLRMNLNTFTRHGVFENPTMAESVAMRLRNEDEIRRARVFPYQLMAAYRNCELGVPPEVRDALQDAMELAMANVPVINGRVVVCADVSGSMASPVTGDRPGASSKVRCVDVAALVAAAVLRRNPTARVLPFEDDVVPLELNPRDSVMTNAEKLASIGGGGTNCSAPIEKLIRERASADLVLFVSDNQSWVDANRGFGTSLMQRWAEFRKRNPQARLVCLDIQPYTTTQAAEREDILNIGGFSDQVFEVISAFASGELEADHWVARIKATQV